MTDKMFAELQSTTVAGEKRISAKYVTGKLNKGESRKIIPVLINKIRKDNTVVNIYLHEDMKQKRHFNCFCRMQWSALGAKHVPSIQEDEIIEGDIYVKWISYHDAYKDIIEREES